MFEFGFRYPIMLIPFWNECSYEEIFLICQYYTGLPWTTQQNLGPTKTYINDRVVLITNSLFWDALTHASGQQEGYPPSGEHFQAALQAGQDKGLAPLFESWIWENSWNLTFGRNQFLRKTSYFWRLTMQNRRELEIYHRWWCSCILSDWGIVIPMSTELVSCWCTCARWAPTRLQLHL